MMKNSTRIISIITASIFAIIIGLYISWVIKHTRMVTLVVPDEFRGIIRIYPDAAGKNYSGTIIVPLHGEIAANDIYNDVDWQIIFARWKSGQKLKIKQISDKTDGDMYIWELDDGAGPNYYFFVGTWSEFTSYYKENKNRLYGSGEN